MTKEYNSSRPYYGLPRHRIRDLSLALGCWAATAFVAKSGVGLLEGLEESPSNEQLADQNTASAAAQGVHDGISELVVVAGTAGCATAVIALGTLGFLYMKRAATGQDQLINIDL